MSWSNAQIIAASVAVDQDQRNNQMDANVGILCPNCQREGLSYDRVNVFTMTAWCSTCKTGFKQGECG